MNYWVIHWWNILRMFETLPDDLIDQTKVYPEGRFTVATWFATYDPITLCVQPLLRLNLTSNAGHSGGVLMRAGFIAVLIFPFVSGSHGSKEYLACLEEGHHERLFGLRPVSSHKTRGFYIDTASWNRKRKHLVYEKERRFTWREWILRVLWTRNIIFENIIRMFSLQAKDFYKHGKFAGTDNYPCSVLHSASFFTTECPQAAFTNWSFSDLEVSNISDGKSWLPSAWKCPH